MKKYLIFIIINCLLVSCSNRSEQNSNIEDQSIANPTSLTNKLNSKDTLEFNGHYSELMKLDSLVVADSIIPASIGKLTNLKYLYLMSPNSEIPREIGSLSSLETLLIDYNWTFHTLPNEIGNLKELEVFAITKSKLRKLPNTIGKLKNLKKLSISWCGSLKALPAEIGDLHNLEKLELLGTAINELPSSILNCTNLKYLGLYKTHIRNDSVINVLKQRKGLIINQDSEYPK